MAIQITENEKAQNAAFQVKNYLIQLKTQNEPQLTHILKLLNEGSEEVSAAAITQAFLGEQNVTDIKTHVNKLLSALNG